MGTTADRLAQLREASPPEAARLVFRKAVYRKVEMGRFQVAARDSVAPEKPLVLRLEFWGPDRFRDAAGTNPYLTEEDLEHFTAQASTCIVILDDERIAASSWMTNGRVYVHELQRAVDVPEAEHYSCRTYVDPGYRGRALMQHMLHGYAEERSPDDRIWGLVYRDNVASIRSLERLGWRQTGEYWSRYVFGKQFSGEEHFAPRPAMTLPSTP
jgi:GNAT superfamily N-acetyltransferase